MQILFRFLCAGFCFFFLFVSLYLFVIFVFFFLFFCFSFALGFVVWICFKTLLRFIYCAIHAVTVFPLDAVAVAVSVAVFSFSYTAFIYCPCFLSAASQLLQFIVGKN